MKKLIFDYPLLILVEKRRYVNTLRYMKMMINIKEEYYFAMVNKCPNVLKAQVS